MNAPVAAKILSLNNVEVVYDYVSLAIKGVSIEVPEGGMVALLGANGAGKSTTLKSISGLLAAERGEVRRGELQFRGQSIGGLMPQDRVRLGIAHVLEGRRVFEHLTPDENLDRSLGPAQPPGHESQQGTGLQLFPPPARAPVGGLGLPLRRRTADAGDWPRPDDPAEIIDARRAKPRTGSFSGCRNLPDSSAASTATKGSRSCSSSRTRSQRSKSSPTAI